MNEIIVHGDFAENYQSLVQDEIQSYHWSREYCTLHPLIVYFIDGDGNIQYNSLCIVGKGYPPPFSRSAPPPCPPPPPPGPF